MLNLQDVPGGCATCSLAGVHLAPFLSLFICQFITHLVVETVQVVCLLWVAPAPTV